MSVTITKTTADAYYKTHLERDIWAAFDKDTLQERAIVTAIEQIEQRLIGGDGDVCGSIITGSTSSTLTDETVDQSEQYYPDRAAYVQALYILINSDHTANGNLTGPKWPGATKGGKAKNAENNEPLPVLADETLRWMLWSRNPDVQIARG